MFWVRVQADGSVSLEDIIDPLVFLHAEAHLQLIDAMI